MPEDYTLHSILFGVFFLAVLWVSGLTFFLVCYGCHTFVHWIFKARCPMNEPCPLTTTITWQFALGQRVRWTAFPEATWTICTRCWKEGTTRAYAQYGLRKPWSPLDPSSYIWSAAEADLDAMEEMP